MMMRKQYQIYIRAFMILLIIAGCKKEEERVSVDNTLSFFENQRVFTEPKFE